MNSKPSSKTPPPLSTLPYDDDDDEEQEDIDDEEDKRYIQKRIIICETPSPEHPFEDIFSGSDSSIVGSDISYQESEEDPDIYTFSMEFKQRNANSAKLETPSKQQPSDGVDGSEDIDFPSPTDQMNQIAQSRAETDAIIDRLLNSCDGNFDKEFDEHFDPAVIKFQIDGHEAQDEEASAIYSTDDEEEPPSHTHKSIKIDIKPEYFDFSDGTDDEEIKNLCSRQKGKRDPLDTIAHRHEMAFKLLANPSLVANTSGRHGTVIAKFKRNDMNKQVILIPRSIVVKSEKFESDTATPSTSNRAGRSTYRGPRPSTSKAAHVDMALPSSANKIPAVSSQVKSEPGPSTTFDGSSTSAPVTDYRIAFAEVEQLLSEDNERNRLFFATPAPPPYNRAMFKSNL